MLLLLWPPVATAAAAPVADTGARRAPPVEAELDLALQSRYFFETGTARQTRWHPALALQPRWHAETDDGRVSVTASPFLRLDQRDADRTHGDLREAFVSVVGERTELHVGFRQIFWGVTEFKHLVDVINQTDLVENIDGEDKLGQPMVELVLSRAFGNLNLYLLPGARERTFPGADGRLRFGLRISDDARFDSGAGRGRVDGAVRWSHYAGPLSWGLYHFSGTNRDPLLEVASEDDGELRLVPRYRVIDQTGLDAQLIRGDWTFKLEAISRSGDGERFAAANLGFERTLVGVLGSRTDLGLVVEYLWDERGDQALNTVYERDLALGARFALNDAGGTEALFGVIWDTQTDEYLLSLEASREIGQDWRLGLEGRAFGGARERAPLAELRAFEDGSAKTAFLQRDSLLQLELTRFF
ncbi:MAG: hypothetical protein AAGI15_04945 [Pseudomonadota bacterium]